MSENEKKNGENDLKVMKKKTGKKQTKKPETFNIFNPEITDVEEKKNQIEKLEKIEKTNNNSNFSILSIRISEKNEQNEVINKQLSKFYGYLLYNVTFVCFFVFLILLSACSTVPKQQKSNSFTKPKEWNSKLKTLNISANISSKYHDEINSGSCKLILNAYDSLSLMITGPFEIPIGKLYSDAQYFVYYDAFNNQILEGKPTAMNLKRAAMVPLSFYEFIRLLRCETPSEPSDFTLDETYKNDDGLLFKNSSNKDYIEYALYSSFDNNLIRYQRKLRTGRLILDLVYKDYVNTDGFQLAKYMIFNFPEIDTKVDLQINKYKINMDFNKLLRFSLPEGIKVYKVE